MVDDIVRIGDHRDIPLAIGMIAINWNRCQTFLFEILDELGSGGDWRRKHLVEILSVELSSVGIAQALNCYANELPNEVDDLADALRHTARFLERARAYRNYYIHGVDAVTRYGFLPTHEDFDNDVSIVDVMREGPFAKIWTKSAKHKVKMTFSFVEPDALSDFANELGGFAEYLTALKVSVTHYFRGMTFRESAPLPPPPPLPDVLEKPTLDHPKLKLPRRLALDYLNHEIRDDEGDPPEG